MNSQIQLDRYELHEKIGEGAFGVVYRATHKHLQRDVAIKIIKADFAETARDRLLREAQAIARLDHPHILQVFDYEMLDGNRHYMATAYLPQGDLLSIARARRTAGNPFSAMDVLLIIKSVALGLEYAHQRGVIHRDIKPSNIFISEDHHVVIGDFGLAKTLDGSESLADEVALVGTPAYIAPESVRGEPADARSDIYALGIVMYELLADEHPFKGEAVAILAQHVHNPMPDIGVLRPELPYAINDIIQKATAKTPQERYPSARDMVDALDHVIATQTDPMMSLQIMVSAQTGKIPAFLSSTRLNAAAHNNRPKRGILVGVPLIVLVLVVGLAVFAISRNDQPDPTAATEPILPAVTPATPDELLVIVATLIDDETQIDVGDLVAEEVENGNVGIELGDRLRVERLDMSIPTASIAESVGANANAAIVVWGQRNAAGYEIRVQAISRAETGLQDLRIFVPTADSFATNLVTEAPALADQFVRLLVLDNLARQGNVEDTLMLAFSIWEVDYTPLIPFAQRTLDKDILISIAASGADDYETADSIATDLIEVAPNDYTILLVRWAANGLAGRNERAIADAQRMLELDGEDGIFGRSLLTLLYYWYNQPAAALEMAAPLMDLTGSGPLPAQASAVDIRIYNGDFSDMLDYCTLHGSAFSGRALLLNSIQGDDAAYAATLPVYLDDRNDRKVLDIAQGLNLINIANIHPIAVASYAQTQYLEGDSNGAALTIRIGLQSHPNDYMLNWMLAEIFMADDKAVQARPHLETAIANAPLPFPIASFKLAELVLNAPASSTDTAYGCDLLDEADTLAQSDPTFYAALVTRIRATQTAFCSDPTASVPTTPSAPTP